MKLSQLVLKIMRFIDEQQTVCSPTMPNHNNFFLCMLVCVCVCFLFGERFWFLHLAIHFIPSYQRNYLVLPISQQHHGSGGRKSSRKFPRMWNEHENRYNETNNRLRKYMVVVSIALEIFSSVIFGAIICVEACEQTHTVRWPLRAWEICKTKTTHPIGVSVETALHKQKHSHSNLR